jgi:hypothetical protein
LELLKTFPTFAKQIKNKKMENFKGQLFQLYDFDNEEVGVVYTNDETIRENFVEDAWKEYLNSYALDVDDFVQFLNKKLNKFERVFLTTTTSY